MGSDITSHDTRQQNFTRAKVLLIDDNADQLTLMMHYLEHHLPEVEVIPALNLEQVMAYLISCQSNEWQFPKLIILDVYMPQCQDGWTILKAIKDLPSLAKQVPIVLLSHSKQAADVQDGYDLGASSYLVKPTSDQGWQTLFQTLRSYWWETVSLPKTSFMM